MQKSISLFKVKNLKNILRLRIFLFLILLIPVDRQSNLTRFLFGIRKICMIIELVKTTKPTL